MRYILNESTEPRFNIAFDNWCLEHLRCPETVFCLWRNAPAVIIGRNQDPDSEVNLKFLKDNNIALIRRSTGGGAVYHDLNNLNYSIYRPLKGGPDVVEDEFHDPAVELIAKALRSMGVQAEIGGRNDIFAGGKKISGFAKRIWQDRVLVHGTLMFDVDIDTLTRALDVPGSKLHGKGVASVRSRVTNIKDLLNPPLESIEEFAAALHEILSEGDGEVMLSEEQRAQISCL